MDSQLISVLIGIGFVVGLPLLEKWIEKIKQGHRSANTSPTSYSPRPSRQSRPPRPPHQPRRPQAPRPQPVAPGAQASPMPVEGERVTRDNPQQSPVTDTNRPNVKRDDLRKGMVWSIILGKPRGID